MVYFVAIAATLPLQCHCNTMTRSTPEGTREQIQMSQPLENILARFKFSNSCP